MVEPVRHRQTKEAGTDMFEPKATAPHLDSTATTFVITHSPSRSNRRDGFGFSEERRGRATEQVRLRASVTGSIENDRRAFAVDRAFRDATRALIQLKSGDGRSRSTRKLPLSVFAIKSGAG